MNRSRITGDLVSQNNIFVDIANDRVGIGSTIPGEKLSLPDSAKIALGNSVDLEIFHDSGTLNFIRSNNAKKLVLRSDTFQFGTQDGAHRYIDIPTDEQGVSLFYDNVQRLATTSSGVSVTGNLNVSVDLDVTDDLTIGGEFNMQGSSDNNKYIDARIGSSNSLIFRSSSGGAGNLVTMLQLGVSGTSLVGNFTLADSSDSSSAAGPEFTLNRNSSSPADADYLGQIKFAGRSDTAVQRNYAKITGKILDASNGTEDGIIEFSHIKAGSQTITGRWRSDSLQLLNGTSLTVAGTAEVTGNTDFNGSFNEFSGRLTVASHTHFNFGSNNDNYITQGSSGNTYFRTASTLFLQINSSGHLFPYTDSTYDLGTNSNRFRNFYADTLYGDGSNLTGIDATQIVTGNTSVQTVDTGSDGHIKFITEGNERLRIHSNGYMSLGNTSAPTKFGIRGSSGTTDATMQIVGNGVSTLLLGQDSDGGVIRGQGGQSVLKFRTGGGGDTAAASGGTEVFRLRGSNFLIGTTASRAIASTHTSRFQIEGTGTDTSSAHIIFNSNSQTGAFLFLGKSRGTSNASNALAANGDQLGTISFHGADGTDIQSEGAYIRAQVDGTSGSNDMPGRLVFATTADGSSSATERLRIQSDGKVLIGHTSNIFSYKLAIFGTDGGNSGIAASRFSNNTSPASLILSKSRSATIGNFAVLQDDDEVGMIDFRGADGTDNNSKVAEIKASIDGTPGSNDMPGRLTFHTTADGASTTTERLRINASGNARLGGTSDTNDQGYRFTLQGSSNATYLQFFDNGTGTTHGSDGTFIGLINQDFYVWNREAKAVVFATNNTERLRITSAGSVRVGNNSSFSPHSAADNLVVGDSSGSNGMTILTNASTGNIFFNDGSGNDGVVQYVHSSSPNYFRIASSGNIRFDAAAISISDDNIAPTAGDLTTGAGFGTPRLHMRGNNAQSGAYELMARFQSGTDANDSGATIVLNHSNDRGLALQGGRGQSNRSFGAIKAVDNIGRLSSCFDYLGGNGQGVNRVSLYTGESTTTNERFRIDSGGGTIISNAGPFPASTTETLHVQGEGHNGHGTSNTRSVFNIVAARTSNTGAMGIWVGARTNENTAVIGTRTANGNLAIETYNSGWGERLRIRSDGKALFYGTLATGNLPLGGNPAPAAIQIRCSSKYNGIAFGENAVSGAIGLGGDDTSTAMVFTANAHPANLGGGVHDTFEWRSGTSGGGGPGKYMCLNTQGDLTLQTGSLKVSNGEGVDFSSTGNGSGSMTNELLDDYEEGTWTPTATNGASGITVYASRYTKVGNKVFIDFRGLLTGTNGGDVRIGGLPYPNMNSSAHNIGPIMHNGFDYAGSTEPVAVSYITGTNSYFQLYFSQTNSNGWQAVTGSNTNGQQFITSLTYFTS